jgi:hypothetical protein
VKKYLIERFKNACVGFTFFIIIREILLMVGIIQYENTLAILIVYVGELIIVLIPDKYKQIEQNNQEN